jgi:hypothetical protein
MRIRCGWGLRGQWDMQFGGQLGTRWAERRKERGTRNQRHAPGDADPVPGGADPVPGGGDPFIERSVGRMLGTWPVASACTTCHMQPQVPSPEHGGGADTVNAGCNHGPFGKMKKEAAARSVRRPGEPSLARMSVGQGSMGAWQKSLR